MRNNNRSVIVALRKLKTVAARFAVFGAFLLGLVVLPACSKPPQPTQEPVKIVAKEEPQPNPNSDQRGQGSLNVGPIADRLGVALAGSAPKSKAAKELTEKYTAALVGTWSADLGNGVTEELTYTADGTYTATLKGPMPAGAGGKYVVLEVIGTQVLKIELHGGDKPRTVKVVFADDELLHPSLQPGITGVFRKK